jgi:hypothetical protein
VHESGQGQLALAAATGEETARPARGRAALRRLLTVVTVAALTIGLFWGYLLQSRTQAANSDASGMVLQGWDLVHGNLLLRGWAMADVSFYTFEVPLDGLISLVYGLRADVVHVAAALEYALLVLFAALVAAGSGRDRRRGVREGWVRGLIAGGIVAAPAAYPGAHILLLGPDHTQIGVPVLATLLVVDLLRPRRWLSAIAAALLVYLMLTWAQLDDPVAEFAGAAPLALACATPLVALPIRRLVGWIRRRFGRPATPSLGWRDELARQRYDLLLFVGAVLSYVLSKRMVAAIASAGGYYVHAIPNNAGKAQYSNLTLLGGQVRALGKNLMYLFGANFWGDQQPAAYGYVHMVGIALALLGLLVAIWKWPRANRVTRTLTLAVLIVLAAGAVSPLMTAISGAHEVAIVLPLSAALAGRCLGPWLAGRRPSSAAEQAEPSEPASAAEPDDSAGPAEPAGSRLRRSGRIGSAARVAAACVLVVAGVGYLADLGYNASQQSSPAVDQSLADWLVAHNLTSGIGGYWDANITSLDSGGQVRIAPVTDGASYGYLWVAKPAWFDASTTSANFIIAHTGQLGAGYVYMKSATDWYGKPAAIYYFGQTVVLVYDQNLLGSLIQPVLSQLDSPGKLARPPLDGAQQVATARLIIDLSAE